MVEMHNSHSKISDSGTPTFEAKECNLKMFYINKVREANKKSKTGWLQRWIWSISEVMLQVAGLTTAAAICAGFGVNLQAWRKRVLKEVHVKVILALDGFLYAQLENVGEVAGGIKPQINNRIANTVSKYTRKTMQLEEYTVNTTETVKPQLH